MTGNPRRCVCPGSYDPITNGHLDVIARAAALYDDVVVAVLHNTAKQGTFTPQERLELIRESTGELPNVRVGDFGDRLIVDVCRELDAGVLVKGIRGLTDYEYELPMALMNREMTGVETLLLPGDPALSHYSSSLIRLIAARGADISEMVPAPVVGPLLERLSGFDA
ncbi:pantetheine-phosphate adenylyltransferase [Flexivirga caeni]|uniref:Phosphopantetheine adenylyltransferase n=1 Tax=Flexivirga caeni TaxID=2294115 RepID=A0A3M9MCH5_9MICO|nr:pantetheine-phosphate adenylyltransferase [Flexivirga caeni]RNI23269.1 pantetheine-phosphate adenylyltransferase [Flexivirga caeni]